MGGARPPDGFPPVNEFLRALLSIRGTRSITPETDIANGLIPRRTRRIPSTSGVARELGSGAVATWGDVEREVPELAAAVRARFAAAKHATMATLRRDGAPRISGTEVEFGDGDVWLGSMPGALKALDLRRDPRVAIHSPTADPAPDGTVWAGEAKLAGTATEVPGDPAPGQAGHRFRVDVTEVVLTRLGEPADHLVVESWHPGRGYQRRERR